MRRARAFRKGAECREIVSALDWFPTLATAAGIKIPKDHPIIDGRDLWPLMTGKSKGIPSPSAGLSLNADVPLRRRWEQGLEWQKDFDRDDYLNAFFYHGSHGELAAVRSGKYKMFLNPQLTIYDLEADPGESKPFRGPDVLGKLRGMAVMFQEEMSRDARQAGKGGAADALSSVFSHQSHTDPARLCPRAFFRQRHRGGEKAGRSSPP